MNKTKKSKRIFYFDALRALAIITVIIFHIYLRCGVEFSAFYTAIPSFSWLMTDSMATVLRCGVDIFLMLSGALSLGRDWDTKSFLKKRLPRIIMPFVFWVVVLSSIIVLFYYFYPTEIFSYFPDFGLGTVTQFIYKAFVGDTVWFIPYWFFWMILGTYLIMPIFNKWIANTSMKDVEYFLVLWAVTCLFKYTLSIDILVNLTYFTGPIGMVVLGYYLRYSERKIFNSFKWGLFFLILGAFLLMFISYLYSDVNSFYIFKRYSILLVIEVIGIFCTFKTFPKLNFNSKIINSLDSIFRKSVFSIAKYSYGIYLIHMVVLNFLIIFFANYFGYTTKVVFLLVMTLIISWGILAVLNRVPYLNQVIGAK